MNTIQRRQADFAFAGYLVPVAWFLVAILVGGEHGFAPKSEGTVTLLMWFVLLPLAVVSLCAIAVGLYCSLKLRGVWTAYPGLVVVPLVLLLLLAMTLQDESGDETRKDWVLGAFVLSTCYFAVRWFWSQRRRAIQEPPKVQSDVRGAE